MTTATDYPHIVKDESGRLVVEGTPYKLLVLLRDHTAWKMDALQIHRQHAGLTLAQAHSVLAYYYDHQAELDEMMQRADSASDAFAESLSVPPVVDRLRGVARNEG